MYINVLELSIELCIALGQELNCLYIIIIDYLLLLSIKSNFLKELLPLN